MDLFAFSFSKLYFCIKMFINISAKSRFFFKYAIFLSGAAPPTPPKISPTPIHLTSTHLRKSLIYGGDFQKSC